MVRIIQFTLVLFTAGHLANATVLSTSRLNLNDRVESTSLSARAKASLATLGYQTLEEVVRYYIPSTLPWDLAREVSKFLQDQRLRLGMSDSDITVYRRVGLVPAISDDSNLRALGLHHRTIASLENEGFFTIRDTRKISLRDLLRLPQLGPLSVGKIGAAQDEIDSAAGKIAIGCERRL